MAYIKAGSMHKPEMQRRLSSLQSEVAAFKASIAVWQKDPWCAKPDSDALTALQGEFSSAVTLLLALMTTLNAEYSPHCYIVLWGQVSMELEALRLNTVAALQAVASAYAGKIDKDSAEKAISAAEAAGKQFEIVVQDRIAEAAELDEASMRTGYDSMEATRTFFAQLALQQLPGHVATLHAALWHANVSEHSPHTIPLLRRAPVIAATNYCQRLKRLFDSSVYFPGVHAVQHAFGVILAQGSPTFFQRLRRNSAHPLRLALTNHSAALLLMILQRADVAASPFVLWALLPCNLCFLPTTGAVVLKSLRRAMGTVVGASLALASLSINPAHAPALFSQLFIVAGVAKYLSICGPLYDYSGLIVGLTWCILVLGNWELKDQSMVLELIFWRIIMTISGVVWVILGSFLIIPNHATRNFESKISEALLCSTEVCVQSLRGSLSSEPTNASQNAKLSFMQATLGETRRLLLEVEAEGFLVKRRVAELRKVQERAEMLANATAVCAAVGREIGPNANAGAIEYCLSSDTTGGEDLQEAFSEGFNALRACTSKLVDKFNARHSMHYARRYSLGEVSLVEAKANLYNSFCTVRSCMFRAGDLSKVMYQGLRFFWAVIYSMDDFLGAFIGLDSVVNGLQQLPSSSTEISVSLCPVPSPHTKLLKATAQAWLMESELAVRNAFTAWHEALLLSKQAAARADEASEPGAWYQAGTKDFTEESAEPEPWYQAGTKAVAAEPEGVPEEGTKPEIWYKEEGNRTVIAYASL